MTGSKRTMLARQESGELFEGDADGQVPVWDNTAREWVASFVGGGGGETPLTATYWVDADSTSATPTGSDEDPFPTIQDALDAAVLDGLSAVTLLIVGGGSNYIEDIAPTINVAFVGVVATSDINPTVNLDGVYTLTGVSLVFENVAVLQNIIHDGGGILDFRNSTCQAEGGIILSGGYVGFQAFRSTFNLSTSNAPSAGAISIVESTVTNFDISNLSNVTPQFVRSTISGGAISEGALFRWCHLTGTFTCTSASGAPHAVEWFLTACTFESAVTFAGNGAGGSLNVYMDPSTLNAWEYFGGVHGAGLTVNQQGALNPVQYVATDATNTVATGADTNYHAASGSAFSINASADSWGAPAAGCVATYPDVYIGSAVPTPPLRCSIKIRATVEVATSGVEVGMAVSVNGADIGTPLATVVEGGGLITVDDTGLRREICAELVTEIDPLDTVQPIFAASSGDLTLHRFSMVIDPFVPYFGY